MEGPPMVDGVVEGVGYGSSGTGCLRMVEGKASESLAGVEAAAAVVLVAEDDRLRPASLKREG